MNLEVLSSSFLDFLQSMESQVGIFHLELSFLKLVLLPEMELILSPISKEGREIEHLVFLIHFNGMLEDKVSNNTIFVLSELLEMIKLIKIEVLLMVQLNYEAHLIRILGLLEGLHCLRKFLCTVVEKVNGCLPDSLIEKIKDVKVVEARTRLLHVVSSSVSNWPRTDGLGSIDLLLVNLRMLLNCRADLFACVKCQIEVLLRRVQPEANAISDVAMGLNDQLEIIINRISRGSLQLDIASIVGMSGLGKTTLANEH